MRNTRIQPFNFRLVEYWNYAGSHPCTRDGTNSAFEVDQDLR